MSEPRCQVNGSSLVSKMKFLNFWQLVPVHFKKSFNWFCCCRHPNHCFVLIGEWNCFALSADDLTPAQLRIYQSIDRIQQDPFYFWPFFFSPELVNFVSKLSQNFAGGYHKQVRQFPSIFLSGFHIIFGCLLSASFPLPLSFYILLHIHIAKTLTHIYIYIYIYIYMCICMCLRVCVCTCICICIYTFFFYFKWYPTVLYIIFFQHCLFKKKIKWHFHHFFFFLFFS